MVVAYYRYSSSSQNDASIEQQRQMVHRWAKSQDLVVVNEYEDAAKTGRNANRPGYQLMRRELPKIKPAYVAVWKNDRLARDRAELLSVKSFCVVYEIVVIPSRFTAGYAAIAAGCSLSSFS